MTGCHATIDWSDGQPFSAQFADVYFSRTDGLAETRHVFIQHNRLIERFQTLDADHEFTIAETGFGTGLNFLCAWQSFLVHAPNTARLHFISFEIAPLKLGDLSQALRLWPELTPVADEILAQYTLPAPGWQHYEFAGGRVRLSLMIGDIGDTLVTTNFQADAWFLDGFAPAKNSAMWAESVLQQIAERTRSGGSLATFTSAGFVRRSLATAGFIMQKVAGHGRKRDMLCGIKYPQDEPASPRAIPLSVGQAIRRNHIIVIGGGLAGCSSAFTLAQQGHRVTLLERERTLASCASGNPIGVLYARLGLQNGVFNPLAQLILTSLEYTTRHLPRWLPSWQPCGVLQLAFNEKEVRRAQALAVLGLPDNVLRWVDAASASQLAGIPITHPGLFFSQAGCVSPAMLCEQWTQHPHIQVHTLSPVAQLSLHRQDPQGSGWQVHTRQQSQQQSLEADHVVLATAHESNALLESAGLPALPLWPLRGQILQLPASANSQALRTVLCAEGYCAPAHHGQHVCGATFDKGIKHLDVLASGHQTNLAQLAALSPVLAQLAAELATEDAENPNLLGRASFRCTGPDFTPSVGELAPGLWASLAHGARGLLSAPLAAALLAEQITGLSSAFPRHLRRIMDPKRFTTKH